MPVRSSESPQNTQKHRVTTTIAPNTSRSLGRRLVLLLLLVLARVLLLLLLLLLLAAIVVVAMVNTIKVFGLRGWWLLVLLLSLTSWGDG
jgi:hypothetical protein